MIDVDNFTMQDIAKKAHDSNQLLSVMLELLTTCNLRCKHCYIPKHDDVGLNTDIILSLIQQLRDMGTLNISLTGGEIFLRKDIFKIIETIRASHMRVFLLSNVTTLTEAQIKKLSLLNITEVSTSIYSLNEKIHDSITTVTGSLKKSLKNIKLLTAYGINVVIKTPLMELNKFEYREIINYCKSNGYKFIPGTVIFAKNDGNTDTHNLRMNDMDYVTVIQELEKVIPDKPFLNYPEELCGALKYSLAIDCKGEVHPCNSFYYSVGNIKSQKIKEIWYNSKR